MTWGTIIILLIMFVLAWEQTHSVLHPAVVTSGLWGILLLIYNSFDHGLYDLTDKFYFAVLYWAIPLCIFSLIPVLSPTQEAPKHKQVANESVIKALRPIAIITVIIAMLALLYRGFIYNPSNIFNGIRMASVQAMSGEDALVSFSPIIQIALDLARALLLPYGIYLVLIKEERTSFSKALIILIILYAIIRSNKGVIAQFGLAFICILVLKKKINKHNALIILSVFFALMMVVQLLRRTQDSSDFAFLDFLIVYFLGAFPAMDSILQFVPDAMIESFNGEYTFRAFLKFIQFYDSSLVGNSDPFNLHNWTAVPILTNVYTILFNFYADFSYIGLAIFGGIYGLIGGSLYKRMIEGYLVATLMYTEIYYVFIFQFFADFGIEYFWSHIAVLLCILLMTFPMHIKFNTQK